MFADLHLHSIYSDGTDTPKELIQLSLDAGLKVIAISDHDTVSAYDNAADLHALGITIIPAIEISTVLGHHYLHLLGYFIDTRSYELQKYIARVSDEKLRMLGLTLKKH
ncbi:MAG: PHP domain-containing protein [Christensenellales bacterium]